MKIRAGWTRGKWNLSKHRFYAAYHYALQYPEWVDEYNALGEIKAVVNDGMPHGTTPGNPTENVGIKRTEIKTKIDIIEETVRDVDADLYTWLIKAVTCEGITYTYLQTVMQIPVSHNTYYDKRKEFYYKLADRLKM